MRDAHLHASLPLDAGRFGTRVGLEEAYRFALGEPFVSVTGQPVKLARPLGSLAIVDDSDDASERLVCPPLMIDGCC